MPPGPVGWSPDHADPAAVAADAQLRAAVAALVNDDSLRRRFGSSARQSVLRRTWSTVCDELLAHYTDVIVAATGTVPAVPVVTGGPRAAA